jgi:phosphoserine/homoserine phosphotransferase
MHLLCLDLEGVLVPEIWISVAEATGIPDLRVTTRDISDYDVLMKRRIGILDAHGLRLSDIQRVIGGMDPLAGAREFLDTVRSEMQVIILSDTFTQFASPLLRKLGRPTLFCNSLVVEDDRVVDYRLRQKDGKRRAVEALKTLAYTVIAGGDSYNDISMLSIADHGLLFRPPQNVIDEFPQFPVVTEHDRLLDEVRRLSAVDTE